MSKKLKKDMWVDYEKMQIIRKIGKQLPDSQVATAIKTVDREWDKQTEELKAELKSRAKKKKSFVTKF